MKLQSLIEQRVAKTKVEILAMQQRLIDLLPDDVIVRVETNAWPKSFGPDFTVIRKDKNGKQRRVLVYWPVRALISPAPVDDGFRVSPSWQKSEMYDLGTVEDAARTIESLIE